MARTTHDRQLDHHTRDLDTNIELDGAIGQIADGTVLHTALAVLANIFVGTADPSSGGGVAHPMPAIYLRNNSNVTEIWIATGTGATAWTKQNSP